MQVRREGAALRLRYLLDGAIDRLRIPPARAPCRTDGLWRHTCFELFVRGNGSAGYREFNFSPSGEWAAYDFADYRGGMRAAAVAAPRIHVEATATTLRLETRLGIADADGALALAAVIEHADARLSYWALAHPAGRPDFHHPDGFVSF